MNTNTIIRKIEFFSLLFLISVLPIAVVSIFANAFDTPKTTVALLVVLFVLVLKSVRALMTNKIAVFNSVFDIPVLILAIVYIASAFLETPNRMDAFFLPGTATVIVVGSILYYLVNQLRSSEKSLLKEVLFFSASFYSLTILLGVAGIFKSIPQLPEFVKASTFTTAGAPLAGAIFILVVAPIGLFHVVKDENVAQRALFGVASAVMAFALLINIFTVLPGRSTAPQIPSFQISWSVAIDSIQGNPLLGVGPGNYLSAFSRFVPIQHNQTDLWSIRFTSGRSYILTLLTEVGIAGIAAFILILIAVAKVVRQQKMENSAAISLGLSAALLVFFPSTPLLLFVFFILLALSTKSNDEPMEVLSFENKEASSRLPILLVVVPVLAFVGYISFRTQRVLSADIQYKNALRQISNNEGGAAYDTLRGAINTNPYVDRYRVSYAQVNLAIANSLASNQELTDQDRQTIATLIQQAIQEGKNAVALNPTKSSNWQVLGSIYRSVAPLAEGANAFAAQTFAQAIALDPINPNLRITLGGIFYAAGQYEDAIDTFELAVRVKPDHANAYYNLAAAYREAGRIDQAIQAMSTVLSLVDRNSEDYNVATTALEELQEKKANAQIPATDTLTVPETDSDQEPVIELDEEAAPPEAPELDENPEEGDEEPEATSTPAPSETPLP